MRIWQAVNRSSKRGTEGLHVRGVQHVAPRIAPLCSTPCRGLSWTCRQPEVLNLCEAGKWIEHRSARAATPRVVGPFPPPVIRSVDVDVPCEVGIEQTGEDSLVDLVVALVGGHDRQQPLDVAVVDDLVELLPGPGGGVLGSQIVEHQQGGAANLVEAVVVGDAPCRVERGAQVVEEIGYDREVNAPLALANL